MTIENWLAQNIALLSKSAVSNPRLDCLVLLEDVLAVNRSNLLAHPEQQLNQDQLTTLQFFINQRQKRVPLAYIRGTKEFYGLDFTVNSNVLIPRPESEIIIDLVDSLELIPNDKIADIGTGSGNLAVSLAKLNPTFNIFAYDISDKAIVVADQNAQKHSVNIKISKSDLLNNVDGPFRVIIANLPYVTHNKMIEPEIKYEPSKAIFADRNGLKLIQDLIEQITIQKLDIDGWLIIESDLNQQDQIKNIAKLNHLKLIKTKNMIQLYQYAP